MTSFRKFNYFVVNSTKVDVYGGNKGGYAYLLLYDPQNREVICHYVTPPKKEPRNIQENNNVPLFGIYEDVNFQSEVSYSDPFVIMNKDRKSDLSEPILTAKLNELKTDTTKAREIKPFNVYEVEANKSFIAGPYIVPVSPADVENPTFQSHFADLTSHVRESLTIFLEFVVKNFWPHDQIYRANIFLYDAYSNELKNRVVFNMSQFSDYQIGFKNGSWPVWTCFKEKREKMLAFDVKPKEEYDDVDLSNLWLDLQSAIYVPILDSDNTSLGVLSVDTNNNYVQAKFKDHKPLLLMLTKGVGRLLEGYSV